MSQIDDLLSRFKEVAQEKPVSMPSVKFNSYAISNFRGGIGKSTLAFNLAWEMSRKHNLLALDVCPQTNFTQSLLGSECATPYTIYDALLPQVMPGTKNVKVSDLLTSVPPYCSPFKGGKDIFVVPGSNELFLFPSLLYTQLSTAANLQGNRSKEATKSILTAIQSIIEYVSTDFSFDKTLIDTSPFFGGATHLAWLAADALIIPARVDEHSMQALRLTLSMLRDEAKDFLRLNKQGDLTKIPKVHAIVMTHCGWSRQTGFTPDRSTQAYLKQALSIANEYTDLLSSSDPLECIHLLDDFHSAGRISGTKRIPLAELNVGEQHTIEGQKLEVNPSLNRYTVELRSLASAL
ncbi:ParA family protein [Trichlorobacter lovleyi]|uniref:ParA family protein n=1 Tax=Trichlorobacter lovleyi TaxID=313985 RepID=UPI003D0C822A